MPSRVMITFMEKVPSSDRQHMLSYFAACAVRDVYPPFLSALINVLERIEEVVPGYAEEMIGRLAAVAGTGIGPYEKVLQILAEIYVTGGGVEAADVDAGRRCFAHEPRLPSKKNPEFEARTEGTWYAVEVKTPELIEHRNRRARNDYQLNARLSSIANFPSDATTLPRDNPVKDFLVSAEAKFVDYSQLRPDAYRILTIVWDDFCNEPITALTGASGLFTERSFYRDPAGAPVVFGHVDGVVVCRYHHQLIRMTREEEMADGARPFAYHHKDFPFKAFIANPNGRVVPEHVLHALNAVPPGPELGAEYVGGETVYWIDS